MKKVLSEKEVIEIIDPYYQEIVGAIQGGFDDFRKVFEFTQMAAPVRWSKRTMAGMIHDYTKARIRLAFAEVENIEVGEFNKIFGVYIDGKVLIRFKKINNDYSTSSYPTEQEKNFAKQEEIVGFPKKPTYIYAGYMPNGDWTEVNNIYILCKNGSKSWHKGLHEYYSQEELVFTEEFEVMAEPQKSRVRVISGNKETGT